MILFLINFALFPDFSDHATNKVAAITIQISLFTECTHFLHYLHSCHGYIDTCIQNNIKTLTQVLQSKGPFTLSENDRIFF